MIKSLLSRLSNQQSMIPKIDCVICVAGKDNLIVRTCIKLIIKNINPENIFIITKPQYRIFYYGLQKKYPIEIIDEDNLLPNLSYVNLDKLIKNRIGKPLRTGWYFQQFLKMGFGLSHYAKNYYLIWDADTLPTSKLSFFENGHPVFTRKTEFHKPYFVTMKKLLNLGKNVPFSFIAENMLIDVNIMKELIHEISNCQVKGDNWFEKIINAIGPEEDVAFSEFETYGTYVTNKYPLEYRIRELRTLRDGGAKYGRFISRKEIKGLQDKFDTVSLEPGSKPKLVKRLIQFPAKLFLYIANYSLDKPKRGCA